MHRTHFGHLAMDCGTRRRPFAARVLMRCAGLLIDLARWLMAPKP